MQEKSHSWNYKTEMFVSSSKKKQICLKQKSVVEQVMQFIKTEQKEVTAILVLRQEILVHTTVESINALQHYWPWEQVRFAVCSSNNSAQTLAEGSCKRQGGCGCWAAHQPWHTGTGRAQHTPGMQQGSKRCSQPGLSSLQTVRQPWRM